MSLKSTARGHVSFLMDPTGISAFDNSAKQTSNNTEISIFRPLIQKTNLNNKKSQDEDFDIEDGQYLNPMKDDFNTNSRSKSDSNFSDDHS